MIYKPNHISNHISNHIPNHIPNHIEMNSFQKTAAKYVPGIDYGAGKLYEQEHNSATRKIMFIGLFILIVGIGILITGFIKHEEGNNSTVLFTLSFLLVFSSIFIIYYSFNKNKK